MLGKPVNKTEFWQERIKDAEEKNKPHYSVYISHPALWQRIRQGHEAIIKAWIKETDTVLDAGCGYGRAVEFLPGKYVGVDFSPDFIEIARKKYPNNTFVQAKLEELPFRAEAFDWAVCISIKKMIEDNLGAEAWEPMQKELKRVAKKVLILEYEEPDIYEIL